MKKIFSSIIIVMSLGISSCKDFLATEPESQFVPEVVYKSLDFTNYAVTGIYSLLTTDWSYSQRLSLVYPCNSDIEWVQAGTADYNAATYRGLSNYYGTPSNDALQREWDNLYQVVERANQVIEGVNNSPLMQSGTDAEKATMNAYLGEAITLRAMAYLDLCRNWGDVPFKTEPTKADGSNFYVDPSDRDDIYDALIADLQKAAELVPWVGQGTSISSERVTKGFVKGLLARVALTRGGYSIRNRDNFPTERGSNYLEYYKIANQACLDVISSGRHRLNTSFSTVWELANKRTLDQAARENLFEVAMGIQRSGEAGYSIGVRFSSNKKYGFQNNANMVSTGATYYYSFDRKDLRRDATVSYIQYSNSAGDQLEVINANPIQWNFAKWDLRKMADDYRNGNASATGKVLTGINWIVMRYSDILLMYAETENELNNGPTSDAKAALKQVRSRAFTAADQATMVDAYVDSKSSKDEFFNAIVDERAFEFGGEGIRKYDLVRWNLLSQKIATQKQNLEKMLTRQAPFDRLPVALFYQFNTSGATDEINRNTINIDDNLGDGNAPAGFQKVSWLSGVSATTNSTTISLFKSYSSGLNAPVANRHVFPMASIVISESNGKLKNGYLF